MFLLTHAASLDFEIPGPRSNAIPVRKRSASEPTPYTRQFDHVAQNICSDQRILLARAAVEGNLLRVNDLLSRGINSMRSVCAALISAAGSDNPNIDIIHLLLEAKAIVDAPGQYGRTALMEAIKKGNVEIAEELIKRGANVNAVDVFGKTPLIYALENDSSHLFTQLIAGGADLQFVNHGKTVVTLALESGNPEIIRLLLETGSDVNSCNQGDCDDAIYKVVRGYFTHINNAVIACLERQCEEVQAHLSQAISRREACETAYRKSLDDYARCGGIWTEETCKIADAYKADKRQLDDMTQYIDDTLKRRRAILGQKTNCHRHPNPPSERGSGFFPHIRGLSQGTSEGLREWISNMGATEPTTEGLVVLGSRYARALDLICGIKYERDKGHQYRENIQRVAVYGATELKQDRILLPDSLLGGVLHCLSPRAIVAVDLEHIVPNVDPQFLIGSGLIDCTESRQWPSMDAKRMDAIRLRANPICVMQHIHYKEHTPIKSFVGKNDEAPEFFCEELTELQYAIQSIRARFQWLSDDCNQRLGRTIFEIIPEPAEGFLRCLESHEAEIKNSKFCPYMPPIWWMFIPSPRHRLHAWLDSMQETLHRLLTHSDDVE